MLPAVLLLLGTGLIFYALWELRRIGRDLAEAEPRQLAAAGRLADLLADLDEAILAVDRRTERLEDLLGLAAARLAELRRHAAPDPRNHAARDPRPAQPAVPTGAAGGAELPAESPPPEGEWAGSPRQPLQDQVAELAEQGLDPERIAERLGLPRGEVRLILNLRAIREPVKQGLPAARQPSGEGGGP